MIRTILRSSITHVLFGFVVMGAWAVYINSEHGAAAALRAGLIQGTISGVLTLIIKRAIETMFLRLQGSPLARVLPWVATASFVAFTLVLFHKLGGTPNLLATIAVPFAVSTTYAIVYTATLRHA